MYAQIYNQTVKTSVFVFAIKVCTSKLQFYHNVGRKHFQKYKWIHRHSTVLF